MSSFDNSAIDICLSKHVSIDVVRAINAIHRTHSEGASSPQYGATNFGTERFVTHTSITHQAKKRYLLHHHFFWDPILGVSIGLVTFYFR